MMLVLNDLACTYGHSSDGLSTHVLSYDGLSTNGLSSCGLSTSNDVSPK